MAAAHHDLGRMIRDAENNIDHQLSMLASDNGVFSCAISRLLDGLSVLSHRPARDESGGDDDDDEPSPGKTAHPAASNSIQPVGTLTFDQLARNATRCLLKCP